MPRLRRYNLTKLWDGAQMATFWRFLRVAFPASRAQHVSDLHSKFTLRPHHVWKYGRHPISNRLGEEKKKEEEKLEYGPMPNVMVALSNIGGALCSTPQSLADVHY